MEKKLSSKNDWITALENLESEGQWVAQGTQDPTNILSKISQKAKNQIDRPNFKSNGKSRPYVHICRIQCDVDHAHLDKKGKEKLAKAEKLLLDGYKGGKPRSRKESINKLSRLKDSQRKSLQTHADVTFQDERDGQRRFNTSKAQSLSNDLIASEISAETLAAYMLATYSYRDDIADDVEQVHSLKPSERKGPEKRVHVTQEDRNPDQSSGDEKPSGDSEEPKSPTRSERTSKKTKSKKSSNSDVLLTDDGRHIFLEGKLYSLHDDSASSDDSGVGSGKSARSKRSRGDSDNSQFDHDSGSDSSADTPHKSKSKKKGRGKN